jgi:Raf kinase inhibitor-like YbhB/YbcL family protein
MKGRFCTKGRDLKNRCELTRFTFTSPEADRYDTRPVRAVSFVVRLGVAGPPCFAEGVTNRAHYSRRHSRSAAPSRVAPGIVFGAMLHLAAWPPAATAAGTETTMQLSSSAFAAGQEIPATYTCTASGISPPLAWRNVPAGTKSIALIVDDPDAPDPAAPKRTWVHWVVYDLPPSAEFVAEGAGNAAMRPPARSGVNDWSKTEYGAPCPPIGRHRYFFKIYALDVELGELAQATKSALENAMRGHVLGSAELFGTYEKPVAQ